MQLSTSLCAATRRLEPAPAGHLQRLSGLGMNEREIETLSYDRHAEKLSTSPSHTTANIDTHTNGQRAHSERSGARARKCPFWVLHNTQDRSKTNLKAQVARVPSGTRSIRY